MWAAPVSDKSPILPVDLFDCRDLEYTVKRYYAVAISIFNLAQSAQGDLPNDTVTHDRRHGPAISEDRVSIEANGRLAVHPTDHCPRRVLHSLPPTFSSWQPFYPLRNAKKYITEYQSQHQRHQNHPSTLLYNLYQRKMENHWRLQSIYLRTSRAKDWRRWLTS